MVLRTTPKRVPGKLSPRSQGDRRQAYRLFAGPARSDPQFVDERVQRLYGGKFDQQVADTRAKLDAAAIKQLHRFQEHGEWAVEGDRAVLGLKDVPDRVVIFKLIGARWYFANENKPAR